MRMFERGNRLLPRSHSVPQVGAMQALSLDVSGEAEPCSQERIVDAKPESPLDLILSGHECHSGKTMSLPWGDARPTQDVCSVRPQARLKNSRLKVLRDISRSCL